MSDNHRWRLLRHQRSVNCCLGNTTLQDFDVRVLVYYPTKGGTTAKRSELLNTFNRMYSVYRRGPVSICKCNVLAHVMHVYIKPRFSNSNDTTSMRLIMQIKEHLV